MELVGSILIGYTHENAILGGHYILYNAAVHKIHRGRANFVEISSTKTTQGTYCIINYDPLCLHMALKAGINIKVK